MLAKERRAQRRRSSWPWGAMTTSCLITRGTGAKILFPNLSYNLFEKGGHYPMFEEPALFDKEAD